MIGKYVDFNAEANEEGFSRNFSDKAKRGMETLFQGIRRS